jgi:hypothetical protein
MWRYTVEGVNNRDRRTTCQGAARDELAKGRSGCSGTPGRQKEEVHRKPADPTGGRTVGLFETNNPKMEAV